MIAYFNEVSEGGPDGYWHYYFSRYSYSQPKFFLHHWGKPIFIFLSAPFSQFGFYGLNIFNIICGLLTVYIAYKWCRKLNFGNSFIVIILIFFAPVFFLVMPSALTEPLFGLLLILSAYLLFSEKYFWGAIVASFMMYSRTEGTFLMLIFAFFLVLERKWKFLPLFGTGFLIYSLIGYFSGHDFLWFFTENPYSADSMYGKGTWSHFFDAYERTFGKPFVIILFAGLLLLLIRMIRNREYLFWKNRGPDFKVFYLAFIPGFVYFMFHVYAWAMGKFASAGLERVVASVVPLLAIVCMYAVHFVYTIRFRFVRGVIAMVIVVTVIMANFKHTSYPLRAWGGYKVIRETAKWFKDVRKPNSTIYYTDPTLVFYCDYNPFSPLNKECMAFQSDCGVKDTAKSYYFWDSQYNDTYCNTKLKDIESCPNYTKIKEFKNDEGMRMVVFESK